MKTIATCDLCIRPYVKSDEKTNIDICKKCFTFEVKKAENKLIEYIEKKYS